jgi:hypothetical protein
MSDLINGLFELCGGFFLLLHCRRLCRDKEVKGVSTIPVVFFTIWGFWNLYFYPALGAWLSFYGGLFVVAANCLWLGLLLGYRLQERAWKRHAAKVLVRDEEFWAEFMTAAVTDGQLEAKQDIGKGEFITAEGRLLEPPLVYSHFLAQLRVAGINVGDDQGMEVDDAEHHGGTATGNPDDLVGCPD